MKMRYLFIIVGFAMSFAWPISAQEKEEVKAATPSSDAFERDRQQHAP
jgi:hypothetical protein